MESINWNLYVEQVNQSSSDARHVEDWEKDPEKALNNVVDPNTEFKSNFQNSSETSLSPSKSYNLVNMANDKQHSERRKISESKRFSGYHQKLLEREENIESGFHFQPRKRSSSETMNFPSVHAYSCSPVHRQNKCDTVSTSNNNEVENGLNDATPKTECDATQIQNYFNDTGVKDILLVHNEEAETDNTSTMDYYLTNGSGNLLNAELEYSVKNHTRKEEGKHKTHKMYSVSSDNILDNSLTSADQLAWALRDRDRLETVSNISGCSSRFELDSNCSDRAETMSTISNISGYEEEIFRIRRLLLLDDNADSSLKNIHIKENEELTLKKNADRSVFDRNILPVLPVENIELQIHKLRSQLQAALADKEKFRIEAIEARNIANMEWQGKYQEVLREKACIEGRLEIAQSEIENQQREMATKLKQAEQETKSKNISAGNVILKELEKQTLEHSKLQHFARESESKLQELNLTLEFKNSEIDHLKNELRESDIVNEKLRIELHELRIEIEAKEGAISGLKEKIADQHVECQTYFQAKLKAENNINTLQTELESLRKSNSWYREQLNLSQTTKNNIQQELMLCQADLLSKNQNEIKLMAEMARLEDAYKELQQRAVREKEATMRRLEVIQADMLEREAMIVNHVQQENASESLESISLKLRNFEEEKQKQARESDIVAEENMHLIEVLKSEVQTNKSALQKLETEHSQLLTKLMSTQKSLNEKELELQKLENDYKFILMSYNEIKENLKDKENTLQELKHDNVSLEVSLMASTTEKKEVDAAIEKLREDFSKVSVNYKTMKDKLREKDKHVSGLEEKLKENEKEKLNYISKIDELLKLNSEHEKELFKLQDVEELNKINLQLNLALEEVNVNNKNLQLKVALLEEALSVREQQLMNQTKNYEVTREEIQEKENVIKDLKKENEELKHDFNSRASEMKSLESSNIKLATDLESANKQLQQANIVIEQFNMLCRKSEEEKQKLNYELKNIKQQLNSESNYTHNKVNNNIVGAYASDTSPQSINGDVSMSNKSEKLENGFVQPKIKDIYNLLRENQHKIQSLTSEKHTCECCENKAKETENLTCDQLCQILVLNNKNLDKIIEYKDNVLSEVGIERQKNKHLENELKKAQELIAHQSGGNKHSLIDSSVQTYHKNFVTSATQTVNENIDKINLPQFTVHEKEIEKLKTLLTLRESEHKEKHRKYERNVRTLLKKVKEHIRGRKIAEKKLEELCTNLNISQRDELNMSDRGEQIELLKSDVRRLTAELETVQRECTEYKAVNENAQEALLSLEKERGKLMEKVSKDSGNILQEVLPNEDNVSLQLEQKAREIQTQQHHARIEELESQLHKSNIIIKDLKTEIFNERIESSQLRKQVSSLRMGLENANDMIDNKNIELGRNKSMCELMTEMKTRLQNELDLEQRSHEETKKQVADLIDSLEQSKAKDPLLEDQIKTLSYHLHQKSQEVTAMEGRIKVLEEGWKTKECSLLKNISTLEQELKTLVSELDSVRNEKFHLQAQVTELRSALHSSVNNYKILKLKFDAYAAEIGKDKLPDLTLNLPSPPEKYDESKILELLHQGSLSRLKPLSNLQNCLDSLKSEMTTLQKQLEAKTMQNKNSHEIGNVKLSNIEEV